MTADLALRIVRSICTCENGGDIADVAAKALEEYGEPIEFDDLADLGRKLKEKGVVGLWG